MGRLGKLCVATLATGLLLAPFVAQGAKETLKITVEDASRWMPPTHVVRRNYEEFRRRFENGDVLIISWEGCVLDDPRLPRFVEQVRQSPRLQDEQGHSHLERIVSGAEVLASLEDAPARLTAEQSRQRLRGILIGEDGTTVCLATFSQQGVADRRRAVEAIRACLKDCGISEVDQRLAGPIMDGYEVDLASNHSLQLFGPLSSAVILASCYWCLRSWRSAGLVFALSLYCQGATLALVHFSGRSMTPLMIVMPPLVLVLGVSGGIHLINYYQDAVRNLGVLAAPRQTLAVGWLPCTLSAGTTAIGMGSLMISHLAPIRDFGLFSAIGVMLTLVAVLCLIPGAMQLWPQPPRRSEPTADPAGSGNEHDTWTSASPTSLDRLALWLIRHHAAVTMLSIGAMVAAGLGVTRVRASVQIHTLFAPHARILQDYAWLEQRIGPLVPIEVLVHFEPQCPLSMFERFQVVAAVERQLDQSPEIHGTMSVGTFLPEITTKKSGSGVATRALVNRGLEKAREHLSSARYLDDAEDGQAWRITARSTALGDLDYGRFLAEIDRIVKPVLQDASTSKHTTITHAVTGAMPLVHTLQHELLSVLFSSFLSAVVLITLVMVVNERGLFAGLVSMVPNVFPMVLLFGLLGWCAMPMDIGSVMTASVALGMAIDGTLHFLTFYRRSIQAGHDRGAAVRHAYRHCAPAMTESTVICGLGLAMFAFSSFLPTQRFAWLMVALLAAALAGDLIVLPALLAGPLGRCFQGPRQPRTTSVTTE